VIEVRNQRSEGRSQKPEVRNQNGDRTSEIRVEVLTPDFGGREELIGQVVDAGPDVFGHNVETVERLSPAVRDRRASYRRSLGVLGTAKRLAPARLTKSGLMVGLGESDAEVSQALRDLRSAGCDIVTIGQYLQPSSRCLPVERYVEPARFDDWEAEARELGFRAAFCGPLVRSSYLAERVFVGESRDRAAD
jgi:lipoic acid synthetase